MKKLAKFQKSQISVEESANVKGGLRFFTYNESIYDFFRNLLSALNIAFSHGEETENDGRKHYCIEW